MKNVFKTVILAGVTAGTAAAQIDTGTMDYWDGDRPSAYIYRTMSADPVDTGTMDYFEGPVPAAYIYRTKPAGASLQLSDGGGHGGAACSATVAPVCRGGTPPTALLLALIFVGVAVARGRFACDPR